MISLLKLKSSFSDFGRRNLKSCRRGLSWCARFGLLAVLLSGLLFLSSVLLLGLLLSAMLW